MTTTKKTLAFGTLEETGDTWLLITGGHVILLDMALADLSLEHKTVSVIGTRSIPHGAPGILKLLVEKLASHDAIANRAFEIFQSGAAGRPTNTGLRPS